MRPGRAANEAQTVRQGREDGGSGARRRKQRPKERSQLTHDSGRDQFIFEVDFRQNATKVTLKLKLIFSNNLSITIWQILYFGVFSMGQNSSEFVG